jgi:glucokinase
MTAQEVFEAAEKGNSAAKEVVREVADYLGRGLAILVDILNPEVIVIGSIFARQREKLWPIAERVLHEEALKLSNGVCVVKAAELGEAIGDYAALGVAMLRGN